MPLTSDEIQQFVQRGFVKIERAFPREVAERARSVFWRACGAQPDDPESWPAGGVGLGPSAEPALVQAINTPVLHEAFDQLVGRGRWNAPAVVTDVGAAFPKPGPPGAGTWT